MASTLGVDVLTRRGVLDALHSAEPSLTDQIRGALSVADLLIELKQPGVDLEATLDEVVGEIVAIVDHVVLGEELDTVLEEVANRARLGLANGVSAPVITAAFQLGIEKAWRAVLDHIETARYPATVRAGLATSLSLAMLDGAGALTRVITRSYGLSEREAGRNQEATSRDTVNSLILGGPELDTYCGQAAALGWQLGEAHTVFVVATGGPAPEAAASSWRDLAARAAAAGSPPIVQRRGATVIGIVPSDTLLDARGFSHRLNTASEGGATGRVGVGTSQPGTRGISVSYRQALRALNSAASVGWPEPVAYYSNLLPVMMVLAEEDLSEEIVGEMLGALDGCSDQERADLLAALDAFVTCGGNLQAAAKACFVHRHTLTARIQRLETLTGRILRDPWDNLLFRLALIAEGRRASQIRAIVPDPSDD
jgi:hypothetical protein